MTATNRIPQVVSRRLRRGIAVGVGAVIVLGALGVGVAYATTRPDAPLAPGTARLVPGDAAVTVHRGSLTAAADAPLRSSDSLTVNRGIAIIETAAGRMFAREGTTLTFDGALPRLGRGDVLIDGSDFAIGTSASKVVIDGLVRVRQGLSLEAGVYHGVATVKTVADELTVPSLRRVVVAGTGAATLDGTMPLVLDATDSWDRRFLGPALELDAALSARSRGLTMQLAGAAASVRESVLTRAAGVKNLTVLADQPVGEIVVAAELARATKETSVFASSLAERAEGASWGLIAYAQGVRELPDSLDSIYKTAVPAVAAVPLDPEATTVVTATPGQKFWVPQPTTPPASVDPDLPTTTTTVPQAPVVVNPLQPVVSGLGSILNGLLGP